MVTQTPMTGKMATAHHVTEEVAISAAAQCNRGDSEWTYTAVPSDWIGRWVLSVSDSNNELLGYV